LIANYDDQEQFGRCSGGISSFFFSRQLRVDNLNQDQDVVHIKDYSEQNLSLSDFGRTLNAQRPTWHIMIGPANIEEVQEEEVCIIIFEVSRRSGKLYVWVV
jgi:hypothetical protein